MYRYKKFNFSWKLNFYFLFLKHLSLVLTLFLHQRFFLAGQILPV